MRQVYLATLAAIVLWTPAARAAEIEVLTPPVVLNAGLKGLAEDFT